MISSTNRAWQSLLRSRVFNFDLKQKWRFIHNAKYDGTNGIIGDSVASVVGAFIASWSSAENVSQQRTIYANQRLGPDAADATLFPFIVNFLFLKQKTPFTACSSEKQRKYRCVVSGGAGLSEECIEPLVVFACARKRFCFHTGGSDDHTGWHVLVEIKDLFSCWRILQQVDFQGLGLIQWSLHLLANTPQPEEQTPLLGELIDTVNSNNRQWSERFISLQTKRQSLMSPLTFFEKRCTSGIGFRPRYSLQMFSITLTNNGFLKCSVWPTWHLLHLQWCD